MLKTIKKLFGRKERFASIKKILNRFDKEDIGEYELANELYLYQAKLAMNMSRFPEIPR